MGVFYSSALTTVSLISIFLLALITGAYDKTAILSDRIYLPLTLVFLVVLVSGFYSEDLDSWQTAVRVKLPFLICPLAFLLYPKLGERFSIEIHYWLIGSSVVVGLPVIFGILRDVSSATELISIGQSVATPIEHVKYSMTVAYASVSAWILYYHDRGLTSPLRYMVIGAMIFLVMLLHMMAVRTGLAIFYISMGALSIFYLSQKSRRLVGGMMIMGSILLLMIAITTVAPLKQKIGYMRYDWQQHQEGHGALYSDSERLLSYKAGIAVLKSSPLIGVGYGDVRTAVVDYYREIADRPDLDKLPHSQFITYLAGAGIIGSILWLFGIYKPLYWSIKKRKGIHLYLITLLYLNYSLSFLVENSLDRSMSVAFLLLLLLPLLKTDLQPKD